VPDIEIIALLEEIIKRMWVEVWDLCASEKFAGKSQIAIVSVFDRRSTAVAVYTTAVPAVASIAVFTTVS